MDHELFTLSLLQLPGIGRKSAWKAIRAIKASVETGEDLYREASAVEGIRATFTQADASEGWTLAEEMLKKARKLNIRVIAAVSPDFPEWLRAIPDPPLILFVKGDIGGIQTRVSVAVIGTREPTDYGVKVAHRFGHRGAEAGCVVVSGLALGCDSAGHRGCLDAGGKTVAVLAHGLDRIYPKGSESLANEILDKGGCWVSEYPPGMRAQRSYFVERDRLQAGISGGVIVVETDIDGGTMHTVRFAQDQGRPVACLQHPPAMASEMKARGNQLLIREKRAVPLQSAEDLCTFISTIRQTAGTVTKLESSGGAGITAATKVPISNWLFPEEDGYGGSAF
jgi:DNA processing protein